MASFITIIPGCGSCEGMDIWFIEENSNSVKHQFKYYHVQASTTKCLRDYDTVKKIVNNFSTTKSHKHNHGGDPTDLSNIKNLSPNRGSE